MLSAFDSITSPAPQRSQCCFLNGFKCQRIGSSRVYHPGMYRRNKVCIVGPHFPATFVILIFIWGATRFFGFIAIETKATITLEKKDQTLHQVACVFMACLCTALLYMTACSDPGIMTSPTTLPDEVANNEELYKDWRWCSRCEIFQGPKTAHCNDCKVCIDELDHHCPWMGKCVGKGNMKWFKWFNLSWVVYFVYVIVAIVAE